MAVSNKVEGEGLYARTCHLLLDENVQEQLSRKVVDMALYARDEGLELGQQVWAYYKFDDGAKIVPASKNDRHVTIYGQFAIGTGSPDRFLTDLQVCADSANPLAPTLMKNRQDLDRSLGRVRASIATYAGILNEIILKKNPNDQ